MEKSHHRHHLKNIFKKDGSDLEGLRTPSLSHLNLSKLFHKEKELKETPHSGNEQKAPTKLHTEKVKKANGKSLPISPIDGPLSTLKRHDTNLHRIEPPRGPLRRSETTAGNFDQKNKNMSSRKLSHHGTQDKIVYNPYGVNKHALNQLAKHSTLFYLKGGPDQGGRVVSMPVADPNDYLPEDLREDHINLLEDFEYENLEKKIGDGGAGDVRIVTLTSNKKRHFALKKFVLFSKETDEEFYKRAAKEYIISRKLSNLRHVVSTVALLRIQSQGIMTRGWGMIMELCTGGDLFNMIVKPGWKRNPLNERYCIFKQIAYGLKFLHDNDIVHKDLKPENVLLDGAGVVKLCDFGVSEYGHEEYMNFDSAVKLSTAYVGSPPYSPPEVMLLKELSPSEVKKHAYDPFKMDCWGLGMLLFCLVHSGVPFQQSSTNDAQYRDYKFSRDRFCSDNPSFKNNSDFSRGPGSEFKWAAQFQSSNAARVAWKLCDPSVTYRLTLNELFNDPWFRGLEMCLYEHPDQKVNPIVAQSGTTSFLNSQAPSRRNTVINHHSEDTEAHHAPIRSMLDAAGEGEKDFNDASSIKSASSLTHEPLKIGDEVQMSKEKSQQLNSSAGSFQKVTLMLNIGASSDLGSLPQVDEVETEKKASGTPSSLEVVDEDSGVVGDNPNQTGKTQTNQEGVAQPKEQSISPPDIAKEEQLYDSDDLKIGSNGCCELGYKIRKHHHLDTSNAHIGGSLARA